MNYTEFSFEIPYDDLLIEDTENNCEEIEKIFGLLGIKTEPDYISKKYDSYYDNSAARYSGDPLARAGRGNVVKHLSPDDKGSFIFFDMMNGCSDQNNMIELGIRCGTGIAQKIKELLLIIHENASVSTNFREGYLNLAGKTLKENFPRQYPYYDGFVMQDIEIYK